MKKLFLIITSMLLLSGCEVSYRLSIDENMIIEEEILIQEENSTIRKFTLNIDTFLNDQINFHSDNDRYKYYNIDKYRNNFESGVVANATYIDFNQYKKLNTIYKHFFTDMSFDVEENIVMLNFASREINNLLTETDLESAVFGSASISIDVPFKVLVNNADHVDLETNTYTWEYDKENQEKDIILHFDLSQRNRHINIPSWVYLLGVFVIIIAIVSLYVYKRYKMYSV